MSDNKQDTETSKAADEVVEVEALSKMEEESDDDGETYNELQKAYSELEEEKAERKKEKEAKKEKEVKKKKTKMEVESDDDEGEGEDDESTMIYSIGLAVLGILGLGALLKK